MGQLTVGAAGFPPSINPVRAFRGGCGMVGYGYGGLGPRFRGDDGLGGRTSFEIVSNSVNAAVGSPGTLRKAGSLVTNSVHPSRSAAAAWSASGVLKFVVARRRAASSHSGRVAGISRTSSASNSSRKSLSRNASPSLRGLTSVSNTVNSLVIMTNRLAAACCHMGSSKVR